ncbi:MAG: zinc ribbon domain-containing protein [Ruminococcus sp.]|nr:zinc ribbon domain-containing protein [Ruminococcus sp.]MCD7772944.1 zinc ribbon domain-containing protein [Ruminococcus sp.]
MQNFCTKCGARLGSNAKFCTKCGHKQVTQQQTSQRQQAVSPQVQRMQPVVRTAPYQTPQNTRPAQPQNVMNLRTYINQYAPDSIRLRIKIAAIISYVLVGLNIMMNIIVSAVFQFPLGTSFIFSVMIALVFLGLTLGIHIGRSMVCAILYLVFAAMDLVIAESLVEYYAYVSVTVFLGGGLWVIFGILYVCTFYDVNKKKREFMNNLL